MREEIAYQEMQEEMRQAQRGQPRPDAPSEAPEEEGKASHAGGADPTRKERAYPHLPSEGTLP
ncbi:MAG TPA: hypothetical protein VFE37_30500 [Chloroflexota bacterium]|nr:hypothetical protein [Chloroflexota bacterium]